MAFAGGSNKGGLSLQVFFQKRVSAELHCLNANGSSGFVGGGDVFRCRQTEPEVSDTLQIHMVSIGQVIDDFIMKFHQYGLDVADGQGASFVNVLGDFVGSDGLAVVNSRVVSGCSLVFCIDGRRVDVKLNWHIVSRFLALHLGEERFLLRLTFLFT